MKKVFLAAAIAVSAVALASTADNSNATPVKISQTYQDTVPGKKDTSTLPSPDTTRVPPAFQLSK